MRQLELEEHLNAFQMKQDKRQRIGKVFVISIVLYNMIGVFSAYFIYQDIFPNITNMLVFTTTALLSLALITGSDIIRMILIIISIYGGMNNFYYLSSGNTIPESLIPLLSILFLGVILSVGSGVLLLFNKNIRDYLYTRKVK